MIPAEIKDGKPLEASLELSVIAWAKARGIFCRKVKWACSRNAPVRVIGIRHGVFIELKKPGEPPRVNQIREAERMREGGLETYFAWSMDDFMAIVEGKPYEHSRTGAILDNSNGGSRGHAHRSRRA